MNTTIGLFAGWANKWMKANLFRINATCNNNSFAMEDKVVKVYFDQSNNIEHSRQIDQSAVELAAKLLKNESLVALPTDTIYGFACSANCPVAISKLYKVKRRNLSKPLAICLSSVNDIYKWCNVTVPLQLLEKLLPGQVTVIFERSSSLNCSINPEHSLIGVRVPGCQFIRSVVEKLGHPIALTSANVSDEKSTSRVEEFSELWPSLQGVFDAGSLEPLDPRRLGSTVVDLSQKGKYLIVRNGCAESLVIQVLKEFGLQSRQTCPAPNS